MLLPRLPRVALGLAMAVLLGGCTTYSERAAVYRRDLAESRFDALCGSLAEERDGAPTRDRLVWTLEYATALRGAGRFEASDAAFDEAERLYDAFADAARVSVSEEAVALMTNATYTDYRGAFHDGIMINVYQVLNSLQRGRFDRARTALVRARGHQAAAVARYGREIEANREAVDKDPNAAAVRGCLGNSDLEAQALAGMPDTRGYENFVNPFADYLNGLFRYHRSSGMSDTEQARVSFARVASMVPGCDAVLFDLDRASRRESPDLSPSVYLIQEDGFAPYREEIRFDLPLPFRYVPYVGIAYPKLVAVPGETAVALVSGGQRAAAVRVCDMDAIVTQSFRCELPSVLTRLVTSAVAKAAVSYATLLALKDQNPWGFLIAWGGALGYQAATNSADTRSWTLLPKGFSVARLPLPESRSVTVETDGRPQTVTLGAEGTAWVIYVRTFGGGHTSLVRTFRLR